ncbi:hypothetical protein VNI00_007604 [Paramarasmius palmivorus]|uniref:DUF1793-domain-containing protein n=1 Tax=Paramarasmius palmivorus TaxID=297713 RepID=A0AAW0D390_9AGAR
MTLAILHIITLLLTATLTRAQFRPSVAPLLVRSPFFNSWLSQNISHKEPQFWNGATVNLGGFIRVDGTAYEWMGTAWKDVELPRRAGMNFTFVDVGSITVTPTRTVYSVAAGPMRLNFTFLSPLEPDDLTLQSFPFGYIYVDAISTDGGPHTVQLYCDVTGEWLSGNRQDKITWDNTVSGSAVFHQIQLVSKDKPTGDMAHDGVLYFATETAPGMTWQSGGQRARRSTFLKSGELSNGRDTNLRCIDCGDAPVFAFSNNLGRITSTSQPVVWAIGYVRDPVINQNGQQLRPYWSTTYNRVEDGIQAFLADFSNAKTRAESLDDKIVSNARRKVSSDYADVVSLSTRQVFGAMEVAVNSSGDPLMFMKDVGLDRSRRVNPVEKIFASFPAYLYINATWARYLLEPILQFHQSPLYTERYAAPDLGGSYPNAQGGAPNPARAIEDSGSMLIMTWAHAKFSGDLTLLSAYYQTLRKWTENLITSNAVAPSLAYQDSDGSPSVNLTNLALKGIIGVRAMAEISHTLGQGDDANRYQDIAAQWIRQWEASASADSDGHLKSSYNSNSSSWGMIYNIYADRLLGTNLVSQEIYDAQDAFYNKFESGSKFGLPLTADSDQVKYHWTLLTAATTEDPSTRTKLLRGVYEKAIDPNKQDAFPITYDIRANKTYGKASPAQGAAFAILSMDMQPGKLPGPNDDLSSSKSKAGAIAGGVLGSIAGIAILMIGFLFWRRRKNQDWAQNSQRKDNILTKFFGRSRPNDRPDIEHTQSMAATVMPWNPTQHHGPATREYHKGRIGSGKLAREMASRRSPYSTETSSRDNILAPPRSPSALESNDNSEVSALRDELEDLRRNMEEMRSRTRYEAPPSYDTLDSSSAFQQRTND